MTFQEPTFAVGEGYALCYTPAVGVGGQENMGQNEGQERDGKLHATQLKPAGSEHKFCCRRRPLYTCDLLAEAWSSEITCVS